MSDKNLFTFIDLFSGAGGFTEGMLLAGTKCSDFKLLVASDIHEHAKMTHEHRFKNQLGLDYSFVCGDIRSSKIQEQIVVSTTDRLQGSELDVIVGGPPCQGFSLFGARNENDPRNDLFRHYLRIVHKLRPKYFVMENVMGMKLMYEGKTIERIKNEVSKLKDPRYKIIGPIDENAVKYGVPQNRERILFIGYREDCEKITHVEGSKQGVVTLEKAIGDLAFLKPWEEADEYDPNNKATSLYQKQSRSGRLFKKFGIKRKGKTLNNHQAAKHTPQVMARFSLITPGEGLESIPDKAWEKHLKTSKKWCVRLHPDVPANTMVTLPDDFVHYRWPRILTVREIARIQSFDDTFQFLGPRSTGGGGKGNKKRAVELPQYTQVGNAVPPLMAQAIGNTLLKHLED